VAAINREEKVRFMVAPWVAVKSSCAAHREHHLNEREISQPAPQSVQQMSGSGLEPPDVPRNPNVGLQREQTVGS
jgi:hypothetical protein